MRVYLDTEFTHFTHPNLISIGLVADNGREFYAVLKNFPLNKCSVFVREVVLPIIEHWPSTTLYRSGLRQSLKQWLNEAAEPLEIVCDFATDADLLIELIDGYTAHVLRAFNITGVTVLSAAQCEQITDAVDSYFSAPRDWPRHHALEDARALRRACAGLLFTATREAGAPNHG